ncbi:glycine--tRNA ligase subunit beta [Buchnera aphidicola]|uniref:glycine--tRNA ligase subunit beta n=1 Tax=Buchnera aphidicola TaxID=9 RepID=UPI003BEF4A37
MKKIFLTEIGTEELPAKLLYSIANSFYQNTINELKLHNIIYEKIKFFATPRRLSIQIINIDTSEKIIIINKKGPALKDSFDKNGLPTQAAYRWAKNCNIHINQAQKFNNKKGEWLLCQIKQKQESVQLILPRIIEIALKKIPIVNTMRWENNNYKFFRPIRNIILLLDNLLLKQKIYGINASNYIHNHISTKEKKIKIQNAKEYSSLLMKEYNIIADYQKRKNIIQIEIQKIANTIHGQVKINPLLIDEVTSLVESPIILLGQFQKKFLKIPEKILIYTIEYHQKCFPVYDQKQKIMPFFILISNIHCKNPFNIIQGNEKVMHSRLEDTSFFLNNDRKIKLESYLPLLKKVIFHKNIGTLYDKTIRLELLIQWIAQYNKADIQSSIQSAKLSKCDLITNMACEFKELKGTIGMYYSLQDGEKKDVSIAIGEHYLPSFSGDILPSTPIGCALSIADKIDTISGMFIINNAPTADKDPFALRRLVIGILRIIIKNKISINLKHLIKKSINIYKQTHDNIKISNKIINFFMIRLFYWYEEKGYNIQVIRSVLSCKLNQPIDIHERIKATSFFQTLDNSKKIILSIKRISNILEKNNEKILDSVNSIYLKEKIEKILFNKINNFFVILKTLKKNYQYKKIFFEISKLEHPIQEFLNTVKIYHLDYNIRINRLTLLSLIKKSFFSIIYFNYLY